MARSAGGEGDWVASLYLLRADPITPTGIVARLDRSRHRRERLGTMTFQPSAMALLHGGCALLYAALAALILVRQQRSQTGLWLAPACLFTAIWAAAVAVSPTPFDGLPTWLELARSAAWYGFILHLYRRAVTARRQLLQTFVTLGLLALLLVGGLPLLDALS